MRRLISMLMLGLLFTSIVISAISVFLFHDVDRDMAGHLEQAFWESCGEGIVFTAIIGAGVGFLGFVGQQLLQLRPFPPPPLLGLFLGTGIVALQYLWEFLARISVPMFVDLALYAYIVLSILISTALILRASFEQKKRLVNLT